MSSIPLKRLSSKSDSLDRPLPKRGTFQGRIRKIGRQAARNFTDNTVGLMVSFGIGLIANTGIFKLSTYSSSTGIQLVFGAFVISTVSLSLLYSVAKRKAQQASRNARAVEDEFNRHAIARLEQSKIVIKEHLHLLSVAFKNFLRKRSTQEITCVYEFAGIMRTSLSHRSWGWHWDDMTLMFGDTFWEFLDGMNSTLSKLRKLVVQEVSVGGRTNDPDDRLTTEIVFAGIHFGDPSTAHLVDQAVYYECGSRENGIKERYHRKKLNQPPILDLMDLPGWCPVSSLLLHITSGVEYTNHDLAPEDSLLISIRNIGNLLPKQDWMDNHWSKRRSWSDLERAGEVDGLVKKLWDDDHIMLGAPKSWGEIRPQSVQEDSLIFFSNMKRNTRRNIKNSEHTVKGINQLHINDQKKLLLYATGNLLTLLDYQSRRGTLDATELAKAEAAKVVFGTKLLECLYCGLAAISLDYIRESEDAENSSERYIYYIIPGSTKGRTATGYFIAEKPLEARVVMEVETLLMSVNLLIMDSLTSIRQVYSETVTRASIANPVSLSEIMERTYEVRSK